MLPSQRRKMFSEGLKVLVNHTSTNQVEKLKKIIKEIEDREDEQQGVLYVMYATSTILEILNEILEEKSCKCMFRIKSKDSANKKTQTKGEITDLVAGTIIVGDIKNYDKILGKLEDTESIFSEDPSLSRAELEEQVKSRTENARLLSTVQEILADYIENKTPYTKDMTAIQKKGAENDLESLRITSNIIDDFLDENFSDIKAFDDEELKTRYIELIEKKKSNLEYIMNESNGENSEEQKQEIKKLDLYIDIISTQTDLRPIQKLRWVRVLLDDCQKDSVYKYPYSFKHGKAVDTNKRSLLEEIIDEESGKGNFTNEYMESNLDENQFVDIDSHSTRNNYSGNPNIKLDDLTGIIPQINAVINFWDDKKKQAIINIILNMVEEKLNEKGITNIEFNRIDGKQDIDFHVKTNGYVLVHCNIKVNGKVYEIKFGTKERYLEQAYKNANHGNYKNPPDYLLPKPHRIKKTKKMRNRYVIGKPVAIKKAEKIIQYLMEYINKESATIDLKDSEQNTETISIAELRKDEVKMGKWVQALKDCVPRYGEVTVENGNTNVHICNMIECLFRFFEDQLESNGVRIGLNLIKSLRVFKDNCYNLSIKSDELNCQETKVEEITQ